MERKTTRRIHETTERRNINSQHTHTKHTHTHTLIFVFIFVEKNKPFYQFIPCANEVFVNQKQPHHTPNNLPPIYQP